MSCMFWCLTDFEKEETIRDLKKGLRLPIPNDGPLECPFEYYQTILQCWHKRPESRLTFQFLADFLFDFKNAIEYYPIGNTLFLN